jgi:hypothetical protein
MKVYSCRLLKTADTKNESLFLIMVEIISWHHKKILSVTINRFSSSVSLPVWRAMESSDSCAFCLTEFIWKEIISTC